MSNLQKKQTLANFLKTPQTSDFLSEMLKEKKSQFVSNLLALYNSNNKFADYDNRELMMCAMNATALNLPLNNNLGYAYIIPYGNVLQFQIGYKGLIQLAMRTGQYRFLNATEIREGEIERNKFTSEVKFIKENPDGKIVGYLAYMELLSGFVGSVYMTVDEIEKHAQRFSKSYQNDLRNKKNTSKWSDPDARGAMSRKTVLKSLLSTYGILSTEMAQALEVDNEQAEYSNVRQPIDVDHEQVEPEPQAVVIPEPQKTINL